MKRINEKIQVGQTIVAYEPGRRNEDMLKDAKVFSVTGVGRKYIKADGMNFDKDTLMCSSPYKALFVGTPAEFSEYMRTVAKVRRLMGRVEFGLHECSIGQLKELEQVLEKLTDDENK